MTSTPADGGVGDGSAGGGGELACLAFAIVAFALHLAASAGAQFGIFRDELYYVACANHLAAGYVDHPPLSIWVLGAWKALFGDSLLSIRTVPAILAGVTVFATGRAARGFGGGRYAVSLSCVAAILAPIFLGFFGYYSMNSIDVMLWALALLLFQRIATAQTGRDWLLLGLLVGLGALNKISMLWLGAGILAGALSSPRRMGLATIAPWAAGLLALLLFLPYVAWNAAHDFAHLEFIRNASIEKYASQNTGTFLSGLPLLAGPVAFPLLVAGFWFLFALREWRPVGIAAACVLAILVVNGHSKSEYFASAMTALIPAGAVQAERWLDRGGWARPIRAGYIFLVAVSGVAFTPLALDVLPVDACIRYAAALGLKPGSSEGKEMGDLPQHYADRFGWKGLAADVAAVYAALPDSEKARCLIYGTNYGEAAAVDYYGREFGLPPSISRHNSYWYWGVDRLREDAVVIVIGVSPERLREMFTDVAERGIHRAAHAMPYEDNLVITVCRGARTSLTVMWNNGKKFI